MLRSGIWKKKPDPTLRRGRSAGPFCSTDSATQCIYQPQAAASRSCDRATAAHFSRCRATTEAERTTVECCHLASAATEPSFAVVSGKSDQALSVCSLRAVQSQPSARRRTHHFRRAIRRPRRCLCWVKRNASSLRCSDERAAHPAKASDDAATGQAQCKRDKLFFAGSDGSVGSFDIEKATPALVEASDEPVQTLDGQSVS